MLPASAFCCAKAPLPAQMISTARTTTVRFIVIPSRPRSLKCHPGESRDPPFSTSEADEWVPAFAGTTILSALAQRGDIAAHPRGIGAKIAGADARGRADIDAAPPVGRGDADHDIVGEAEPAGAVAGLDAARPRIG